MTESWFLALKFSSRLQTMDPSLLTNHSNQSPLADTEYLFASMVCSRSVATRAGHLERHRNNEEANKEQSATMLENNEEERESERSWVVRWLASSLQCERVIPNWIDRFWPYAPGRSRRFSPPPGQPGPGQPGPGRRLRSAKPAPFVSSLKSTFTCYQHLIRFAKVPCFSILLFNTS